MATFGTRPVLTAEQVTDADLIHVTDVDAPGGPRTATMTVETAKEVLGGTGGSSADASLSVALTGDVAWDNDWPTVLFISTDGLAAHEIDASSIDQTKSWTIVNTGVDGLSGTETVTITGAPGGTVILEKGEVYHVGPREESYSLDKIGAYDEKPRTSVQVMTGDIAWDNDWGVLSLIFIGTVFEIDAAGIDQTKNWRIVANAVNAQPGQTICRLINVPGAGTVDLVAGVTYEATTAPLVGFVVFASYVAPEAITAEIAHTVRGITSFTASQFYRAPINTQRGDAAGFSSVALVRPKQIPTAFGVIYGNFELFQTNGGWHIAYDGNRFVWGVHQASDGQRIANGGAGGADYSEFRTKFLGRLFHVALVYDGTTMRGYLNGEEMVTLTPSGGLDIADASLYPIVGENNSGANNAPNTSMDLLGAGYLESVLSASDVFDHFDACMQVNNWTAGDVSFENRYDFSSISEGSAPSSISDQVGSGDLTAQGAAVSIVTRAARW